MKHADSYPVDAERELAEVLKNSKVPAISRAAAVLRLLGKSSHSVGVHTVARALDIVPSTCLHILRALVAEELVAFDPNTKHYSLDAGVLSLARHWLRQNRFTDIAQPVLDQIGEAHDVTAMGVRIVGLDHIIVVALSQARATFQVSAEIGSRFPALISATGRCIAAFSEHPRTEIERRFQKLRWDNPPSLEQWRKEVTESRDHGYAADFGNYIAGVTVISAPVMSMSGQMNHALVAIGIGGMFQKEAIAPLAKSLVQGARTLSHQLAGD
jgi:DNA-binding IclR family transcriptional regulator